MSGPAASRGSEVDELTDRVEQALDAVIDNDRDRLVTAARGLRSDPQGAFELLRYVAWAGLQDVGGPGGLSAQQQDEVTRALLAPASPWASVLDPAVLPTVVGVLAGTRTDLGGVPADQLLPALLAVAAYAVVKPVPTAEWFDWRQHYRAVVDGFLPRQDQPSSS